MLMKLRQLFKTAVGKESLIICASFKSQVKLNAQYHSITGGGWLFFKDVPSNIFILSHMLLSCGWHSSHWKMDLCSLPLWLSWPIKQRRGDGMCFLSWWNKGTQLSFLTSVSLCLFLCLAHFYFYLRTLAVEATMLQESSSHVESHV